MSECIRCKKALTNDEIGLHKKLVNRGAESFMCISCLSEYFNVSEDTLRKKIEQFREQGCVLFA